MFNNSIPVKDANGNDRTLKGYISNSGKVGEWELSNPYIAGHCQYERTLETLLKELGLKRA